MPGPASLLQVLEKPSTWSLKTQDVGGGSVRSGAAGAIYFQVSGVIREAINYIALKKKKKSQISESGKIMKMRTYGRGRGLRREKVMAPSPLPHPDLLYKRLKETIQVAVVPGRRPLQRLQDKIFWL